MKIPIFKITAYVSENVFFKIPVKPPILRNSKGLLLFLKGTATLIISMFYQKELYKTMNFDTSVIKIG